MAATAKPSLVVFFVVVLVTSKATATTLTLHNLCPYPVWPLITPNSGFPAISDPFFRLDGGGHGLISLRFPPTFWAGRIVPRTSCSSSSSSCETGAAPPATVVQLAVHSSSGDVAAYSVSLVDGFNVPAVVSPQAVGGGQCPALGCAADLNNGCSRAQLVVGVGGAIVACGNKGGAAAGYFKARCPMTRTTRPRPPTWSPCRSGALSLASSRSSSASPPWSTTESRRSSAPSSSQITKLARAASPRRMYLIDRPELSSS